MAIYHLTAKMVLRSEGRNAVAAAAYRSGTAMVEEATGITHDYSGKLGVEHSEILAPEGAPAWVFDRSKLWNEAEACEKRCDAQVAREIEIGLPLELSKSEQIALLREFVKRELVSRGMVADFNLHLDNPNNPHAHILLTTRSLTVEGFGLKNRSWNQTAELVNWRRGWAEVTNEHLARAGLGVRIDHRSYREQKLELIPGRKIGLGKSRQEELGLPSFLADRIAEQQRIMGANGVQILKDPGIALKALTHGQATFTHHDVARFLNTRTENAEQFSAAYLKVTTSSELVALGTDDQGRERFTTREMLGWERSMLADAQALAQRAGHGVSAGRQASVPDQNALSAEQRQAFEHVTSAGDLKVLVGVAGSGKSRALGAMREAWEAQGLTVKGAALAGIAAENLQVSAGITSRTLASYELSWSNGRDPLSSKDVLVIDEAGMLGTKTLGRVLEVAHQAQAKVVLVGDAEQLQAIEAGAAFRGIAAAHGVAQLSEVRRQTHAWQRAATAALGSGKTPEALAAYEKNHTIVAVERREDARSALLARWARDAKAEPKGSQLVLAFTRDEVKALNSAIRTLREQTGKLGASHEIGTESGKKVFAVHDRVRFERNEQTLGVKNGSLGTIEKIDGRVLHIQLDGAGKHAVAVDTKFYKHLDHGYAMTVHKAQGSTVDRSYVLATPHFDRHTTYVALSRHREAASVFYAGNDFGGRGGTRDVKEVQAQFVERLSRAQGKDLAHDYLEKSEHAPVEGSLQPDKFAGLKLGARSADTDRRAFKDVRLAVQQPARRAAPPDQSQALHAAVDRYARAWTDAARMSEKQLPVLAHQQRELRQAGLAVEHVRVGAQQDVVSALEHQSETRQAMRELQGLKRAAKLVAGLEQEARVRKSPALRAERLLSVWNGLESQHRQLGGWEQKRAREQVEEKLKVLARELKEDPRLEAVLQQKQKEWGIERGSRLERVLHEPNIERALSLSARGPEQDLGLSR